MNLVAVTNYDKSLYAKLKRFEQYSGKKLTFLNNKSNINKTNNSSVELCDLLYQEKQGEINNICYIKGTSDNGLFQLDIINLNNSQVKTNLDFIESVTEYAFTVLNAKTTTILSNDYNENDLMSLGYESLGEYNGMHTYVKDREKQLEMSGISK